MNKNLLKTLFISAGLLLGGIGAQAEDITATLQHTAGTQWGANTNPNTVDSDLEHYNNDASGSWAGAAYAEFSLAIPDDATITGATLTYSVVQGNRSGRDEIIYYMNPGFTLDYDLLLESNGQDLRYTDSRTLAANSRTLNSGENLDITVDVTDAVKTIADAGQNYVIFQWTGNAGGADLYGKTSDHAPVLTITTASASEMTTYTVKFTDASGQELKTAAVYDVAIGASATASEDDMAAIYTDDNTKKYIYESGNSEITADATAANNVITLVFREAATYNYTINASVAEQTFEVTTGSNFEGEIIEYNYPRYYNIDGTLYEIPNNGSAGWYKSSFTLSEANQVVTVTGYAANSDHQNIVYLEEAEKIEGLTVANETNAHIRTSMGQIARNAGEEPVTITTLPAGKYKLSSTVWGSSGTDFLFKAGDQTVLSISTQGYSEDKTGEEFTLTEETAITLDPTESGSRGIDYVLIEKTGDVEVPQGETATFDFNANEWGLPVGNEGNIGDRTLESGGVVASFTDGGTPTRMWGDAPNTHVRIYAENPKVDDDVNGTMTLTAPDGKVITKVEFDATGSDDFNFTVTDGTLEGTTWTGNASAVTFTTENGQTRLNKVVVTVEDIPIPEVQNLAALKAMEETGTEVKLILNGTKVTILSQTGMLGPVTIIEDASGAAVQLPAGYGIDGDGIATMFPEQFAKAGVALNGYLYCAYDPSMGGMIMPSENTANSEFTATDTEITPTVMTIAEANTDANANRFIQLQNVEINEGMIEDGENSIAMQDMLGVMTDPTTGNITVPEGKININGFMLTMDGTSYTFIPVGNPPYTEVTDPAVPEVQNLAALKAMEETGTEVKLILNGTKVTILSQTGMLGPVTIIEDASGAAVQLPAGYGIDGDGIATMFPEQFAKAGVALNGYLYCAYDPSMGGTIMPSENTANSEFTATDTEVTPTVMTIAEASTDANANRYIQLQNVEINESYEIVDGESSILMQDLLGAMTDMTTYETVIPEGKININGFIMTMDPGSYWFVPVGNPPYTEIVEKPEPSDLRVWDFTKWSDATVDNLEAEAVNHTDEPAPQGEETGWRRYEKDGDPWEGENGLKDARTIYWYGNLISEPTELKANGETIEETAGLLFNNVTNLNNTVAIAIDYPSAVSDYDGGAYLWLNGADLQFTIQSVLPGQKVLMEVESHRDGSGRGVSLSVNGTAVGESAEPSDGKVSYEWTIPAELGTEPVDVLVTSTNGCHIYRLEVGNADLISVGINEVNAENGVQNDNVYTINGVMVRKAGESLDGLAKGLYIIGGKKVVIK